MQYDVDTLIIGGGPAGASCAITLQKKQIPCLLLDKSTFPRGKTCGGLMTDKTYTLLKDTLLQGLVTEAALAAIFCDESDTLELYDGKGRMTRSRLSKPLRSVRRIRYDNFLIEQYRALGGTLLQGQTGYRLEPAENRAVLQNGDVIRYRHLVAADGALSKTRAALGCKPPKLGFCVETYVDKKLLPSADVVQIHFDAVPDGYAWVFPSGEELCIGLGGVYDKETDYPALLRQFLTSRGVSPDGIEIKGAFLPIDAPVAQSKAPRNAMLVGDAGCFVDPLYGEGLYYTLYTGIAAAEAIAEGGAVKTHFLDKVRPVQKQIRQGAKVQKLFFRESALRMFEQRMRGRDGFAGFYCDNQLSAYNYAYAELWKLLRDYKSSRAGERKQ